LDEAMCKLTQPSADSGLIWTLTRSIPNPVSPPTMPVAGSVDTTPQTDWLPFDGPWTGYDWTDSANEVECINGRLFGSSESSKRRIWAA